MRPIKLCVVTTHPIQYIAPWFQALASDPEIALKVVYFREPNAWQQGVGFGQAFTWDVPLRNGYPSVVLDYEAGLHTVPGLLWALAKSLRTVKPDVVLITGWSEPGLIAAYPLSRLLGFPIIVRGESNALRQRTKWVGLLHRALLRLISAALVIGKSNRQFYLSNGVPDRKLFDGAYFVESQRMQAMAEENQQHRAALRVAAGYTNDDFVFCFVGKHVSFKRPMLFVEAAALVRARGYDVKLHIAGSGELTEGLRQRAEDLSVPVYFTGFLNQSELWKAYVPADAFVLPSTSGETWGLVTNEAMLFGLPVIVSDQVGCGPDLVRERGTGFIFSGEADGLAQAMEKLLVQRAEAAAMGGRGRQLVLAKYSMQTATAGLKAALAAVVGQHST